MTIHMSKRTIALSSILGLIALIGIGASVASAHGFGFSLGADPSLTPEQNAERIQTRFQEEADLLGTDVDTVKNAWSNGTTLADLADSLGIDQTTLETKLQEQRTARMQEQLQSLVDQGVITQDQADTRLQTMGSFESQHRAHRPEGGRMMMHGL